MYIPVRIKFSLSICIALTWLSLCAWICLPWIRDLGYYITFPLALLCISLIALIPGFMNAFLLAAYLFDKRPKAKPVSHWLNISVLVPAFNEEVHIKSTIDSIIKQNYLGLIEIIVIDNGSKDATLEILKGIKADNLIILEEKKKGKANALNTGLAHTTHDYIVTIDADTHLMPSTIKQLALRYLNAPAGTAAVAGSVYVKNSRESVMTRLQEWDYFISIATIKRMQSLFQATLVAQGALSLYQKRCILEVGGWRDTVGEDIVMTWGFLALNYRVDFSENAISFTSAPTAYKVFFHQRSRWSRGMVEAFIAYPKILVRPRLITFVVYWNFLYPALDMAFVFIFVPGIIGAFFGHYLIAGPMTLAVLPIAMLMNLTFFLGQRKMFKKNLLRVRRNVWGYFFYMLFYNFLMTPACIHGYIQEIFVRKKRWGTK
ncbi:MAG TPA: glycosyl transferase family 2 [Legionella sp.]|nr:glycosyl transferase family 2 [Legionella sp.]